MHSNCLIFALRGYIRAVRAWAASGKPRGQQPQIIVEPSDLAPSWVPRCTLTEATPTGRTTSRFAPLSLRRLRGWRVLRVLWFRGHVQSHDEPN
jgi:hypothetical protein